MESLNHYLDPLYQVLNASMFRLGKAEVTLWSLIYVLILFSLLVYLSGRVRDWISDSVLARRQLDIGVRKAIGKLVRYAILTIGFIVIVQMIGIDLTTLTVLAGALGVGIGFGLQAIVNNFVSGLIILFERPIKVGDRVEVGDVMGNVTDISIRATTILTNDNISIIVPNSDFISKEVINWSYGDPTVRFKISVGVSYQSDPELVEKLLLEVAAEDPHCLKSPEPRVTFDEFGDSSLNFTLRVWTDEFSKRPGAFKSQINFAIHRKFKRHGIEIPFPQRDLHIRSGSLVGQSG